MAGARFSTPSSWTQWRISARTGACSGRGSSPEAPNDRLFPARPYPTRAYAELRSRPRSNTPLATVASRP